MQAGQRVSIGCTMLEGSGKQGILKPIDGGYYRVPLGAYGGVNCAGYRYDLASGLSMFAPDGPLMRQIRKGVLYGEFKHPAREPQWSDQDYMHRIRMIDEDRWAFHIRKLDLVPTTDEKGRPITMVIGEIIPFGPYKDIVQASLDNPHQNTYFSVRSITMDDLMRGIKYTKEIITWDLVGEGGIYVANKFCAPSLEHFQQAEVEVTPTMVHALAAEQHKLRSLGLESGSLSYDDLIQTLGWERLRPQLPTRPAFMRW